MRDTNVAQISRILGRKHVILVGGNATDRRFLMDDLIGQLNVHFIRFPYAMKTIEEYINHIKSEKLFKSRNHKKGRLNGNQLLDLHRDWILETNTLVAVDEFQMLEKDWQVDLLKTYTAGIVNRKKSDGAINLILSMPEEKDLLENLAGELSFSNKNTSSKENINWYWEVVRLEPTN